MYVRVTSQPTSKVRKQSLGRHLKHWNRCPQGPQRKPQHPSLPWCWRQADNGACALWCSLSSHSRYRNRCGLIMRATDKLYLQHPQPIPVTAKEVIILCSLVPLSTGYKPACSLPVFERICCRNSSCIMVVSTGPRFWKGTFSGRKFKLNRNGIFCRKVSIVLKSSRKNVMTASHLDKAEKSWYCIIWI